MGVSGYEKELIQRVLDYAAQELGEIGYRFDTHAVIFFFFLEIKTRKAVAVIRGGLNDIEWFENEKK